MSFMRNISIVFVLLVVFSSMVFAHGDLKQEWIDAKAVHKEARDVWKEAQVLVNSVNTPENVRNVIDKAKISLNAGLDEAIAYFEFQKDKLLDSDISDDLKVVIQADIDNNLGIANDLKNDVAGITTRLQIGIVTLKIVDKYLDLLVDIMRDTGLVFVEKGNNRHDKLDNFRDRIESNIPADSKSDYQELLDKIENNMNEAKSNINSAEAKYKSITQKQGSGVAFREGNNLMRQSNQNMKLAFENLRLIVIRLRGGQ